MLNTCIKIASYEFVKMIQLFNCFTDNMFWDKLSEYKKQRKIKLFVTLNKW